MFNRLLGRNDVKVNVKCMDGTVETFCLAPSVGIAQFKNLVEEKLPACPAARQRLICRGKILHDEDTIGTHIKEDGSTVHVVVRPEAPAPRSPDPAEPEPGVPSEGLESANLVEFLTRFFQSATQGGQQRQPSGEQGGARNLNELLQSGNTTTSGNIMAVVVGGTGGTGNDNASITNLLSQVLSQGINAANQGANAPVTRTTTRGNASGPDPNAGSRISEGANRIPAVSHISRDTQAQVNSADLPWTYLDDAIRSTPLAPTPTEPSGQSLQSYLHRLCDFIDRIAAHSEPPPASIAALSDIMAVTARVLQGTECDGAASPTSQSTSPRLDEFIGFCAECASPEASVRSARSMPISRSALSEPTSSTRHPRISIPRMPPPRRIVPPILTPSVATRRSNVPLFKAPTLPPMHFFRSTQASSTPAPSEEAPQRESEREQ